MRARLLLSAAALLAAAGSALAADYLSLAEAAVMYDTPSVKGKPLFVVRRHTPVEVVVSLGDWVKVRDADGAITWIEKRSLTPARTVIATVRAQVRQAPDANAPLAFEAERGVVLDLQEAAPPGWVKVRHRDGQSGFVRVTQVWGL